MVNASVSEVRVPVGAGSGSAGSGGGVGASVSSADRKRIESWRFTPLDRLESLIGKGAGAGAASAVGSASAGSAVASGVGKKKPMNLTFEQKNKTIVKAPLTASEVNIKLAPEAFVIFTAVYDGNIELAQEVNIELGENSTLYFATINTTDDKSKLLISHNIRPKKGAILRHSVVNIGSDIARFDLLAGLQDANADVSFSGAYFAKRAQHLEHHIDIIHNSVDSKSRVNYKGVLKDKGTHGVWVADAVISPNAKGTDTYVLNNNLVLTRGALVDSVPNLEILTGDIESAGHASTTGRFDEEQLFYLMSRGIDKKTAEHLVVKGFFESILGEFEVDETKAALMEIVEKELQTEN
jgi:Fe-S cluster assembly protein SufD